MTRYPVPSRWIATLGLLLIVPGGAYAQTDDAGASVLQTKWGAPDLAGIWDFRTRTPLQRPADLGEQAFWSDEEAAAFLQQTLERRESRALSPGGCPRRVVAGLWQRTHRRPPDLADRGSAQRQDPGLDAGGARTPGRGSRDIPGAVTPGAEFPRARTRGLWSRRTVSGRLQLGSSDHTRLV